MDRIKLKAMNSFFLFTTLAFLPVCFVHADPPKRSAPTVVKSTTTTTKPKTPARQGVKNSPAKTPAKAGDAAQTPVVAQAAGSPSSSVTPSTSPSSSPAGDVGDVRKAIEGMPEEAGAEYIKGINAATARREQDAKDRIKACEDKKKEIRDLKAKVINFCTQDQKKEMAKDIQTESISKTMKALEACSETYNECLNRGKEDIDIPGLAGSALGAEALSAVAGAMEGIEAEEKRCSKYNDTDYNKAIKDADESLEKSREKVTKIREGQLNEEAKAQEELNVLKEQFIAMQEAKTKADLEKKEADRNQQASYDKQIQEYTAKIAQINTEIFSLQQQYLMQLKNKGSETEAYKLDLMDCKSKAQSIQKSQGGGGSNLVTSMASATGSNSKQVYQICIAGAIRKRQMGSADFNAKIQLAQMNIDNKMKELEMLKQSATSFESMFKQAQADQSTATQENEKKFLEKMQQHWSRIQDKVKQNQKDSLEKQRQLGEANTALNNATKSMTALKGEVPATQKSSDIKESFTKIQDLSSELPQVCSNLPIPSSAQPEPGKPAQTAK